MAKQKLNLLVVHGNAINRGLIEGFIHEGMQDTQVRIEYAPSLKKALSKKDKSYDVCLFDCPVQSEEEIEDIRFASSKKNEFPIICLTHQGDRDFSEAVKKVGAKDCLDKVNLSSALLCASIRYVLESHQNELLRKHAESRAKRFQERNERLLFSVTSILIGVNEQGIVTFWNSIAEQTFGLKSEDVVNRPLADAKIDWDFKRVEKGIHECLREDSTVRLDAVVFTKEGGEEAYLGLTINPLSLGHDETLGVLLFGADITERKRAREKLQAYTVDLEVAKAKIEQQRAKDGAILASIGDGLIATDKDGRISLLNRQSEIMFGWTSADVTGKVISEVMSIQDEKGNEIPKTKHATPQALATGKKVKMTAFFVRKDKHRFPIQITAAPVVLDGATVGVIEIARDITAEKEMENMKSEFVSTVSHELRTPLTSIREGVAQVLEGLLGEINADQKEFLNISLDEVDRLSAIINDLLDISKIEAGKVVLKKTLVDVKEMIHQIIARFQSLAKNKEIEIKADLPEGDIEVFLDPEKITQVITNLLSNAYKFTEANGTLTVVLAEHEDEIEIGVIDNGIGIAEEGLTKLFSKFIQIGRTAGPGIKGTGLGLAICKNLVELHKGRIWVKSELGKGSEFRFAVPKLEKTAVAEENIDQSMKGVNSEEVFLSIMVIKTLFSEEGSPARSETDERMLIKEFRKRLEKKLGRIVDIFFLENDEGVILFPTDNEEKLNRIQDSVREIIKECSDEMKEKFQADLKVRLGVASSHEDARAGERLILDAAVSFKEVYLGPERRQSSRKSYFIDVVLNTRGYEELNPKAVDISLGGVRLMTATKISVGSIHDMKLQLPKNYGEISAKAIAVWGKPMGDAMFTVGFKFLGMSAENETRLKEFIREGMLGFEAA